MAPDTEHRGLGAEMEQEALRHRGLSLGSLSRERDSFYCLSRDRQSPGASQGELRGGGESGRAVEAL